MATYKLIPSSWSGAVANPSNAYNDTTNTTSATVGGGVAYLGGFDFSVIPQGYAITSITVKFKAKATLSHRGELYSGVDGVPLSEYQSLTSTATVYELQLSKPLDTILGYLSTLCIKFNGETSYSVYGAEINVEAVKTRNKIVYGNETLIDLTGDTATASDVASGKTFHLASGVQATGNLNAYKLDRLSRSNTTTSKSIVFSAMLGEPQAFVLTPRESSTYTSSTAIKKVVAVVYNGNSTYGFFHAGGTSASTSGVIYDTNYSFSYSNNKLTVSTTSNGQFSSGVSYYLTYIY